MKATTLSIRSLMRSWPFRLALLLIPVILACFGVPAITRAVSPAPDGSYAGGNTTEGAQALNSLTTGTHNTAIGARALFNDTSSLDNTAVGWRALYRNTTAVDLLGMPSGLNTAIGSQALYTNNGIANTATGDQALYNNKGGFLNTATGVRALLGNVSGHSNTAEGADALNDNSSGSNNVAIGYQSGIYLTTGDNNINIGAFVSGGSGESDTIRIGTSQTSTYIAGISGATASGGAAVFVNSAGQLGTLTSSARFKDEIKPMGRASEAVLAFKPVTFRYKKELDPEGLPQFGLIAEDVEKVNPCLVARDAHGKAYTVRYEAVNAMLLNEFLKEHCKVEQLEKQVEKLSAGLQKVSAELEATKPSTPVAVSNQ